MSSRKPASRKAKSNASIIEEDFPNSEPDAERLPWKVDKSQAQATEHPTARVLKFDIFDLDDACTNKSVQTDIPCDVAFASTSQAVTPSRVLRKEFLVASNEHCVPSWAGMHISGFAGTWTPLRSPAVGGIVVALKPITVDEDLVQSGPYSNCFEFTINPRTRFFVTHVDAAGDMKVHATHWRQPHWMTKRQYQSFLVAAQAVDTWELGHWMGTAPTSGRTSRPSKKELKSLPV